MAGRVCPWRNAYTFDNVFRNLVHKPKKILGPYLEEGMTVLDVGCGMGFFSIGMAELLGPEGKVIAVDLQPQMLEVLHTRAVKRGVAGRIITRQCQADGIEVPEKIGFALTFWMLHEVPDKQKMLSQIESSLEPGARYLLVEPRFHVSRKRFEEFKDAAVSVGFKPAGNPRVALSYAALFEPAER